MESRPQEVKATWGRAYAIWWGLMWRMAVGLFIAMAIVVYVTETFLPFDRVLRELLQTWTLVVLLPLGVWALKRSMNRNFKDFRLALLPLEPDAEMQPNAAPQQEKTDKTDDKAGE